MVELSQQSTSLISERLQPNQISTVLFKYTILNDFMHKLMRFIILLAGHVTVSYLLWLATKDSQCGLPII